MSPSVRDGFLYSRNRPPNKMSAFLLRRDMDLERAEYVFGEAGIRAAGVCRVHAG